MYLYTNINVYSRKQNTRVGENLLSPYADDDADVPRRHNEQSSIKSSEPLEHFLGGFLLEE